MCDVMRSVIGKLPRFVGKLSMKGHGACETRAHAKSEGGGGRELMAFMCFVGGFWVVERMECGSLLGVACETRAPTAQ